MSEMFSRYFKSKFSPVVRHSTPLPSVTLQMNMKLQVDTIYTDFSAAFDSVDHVLLLHKLTSYGICGKLLEMFSSYLKDRYQVVNVNSATSSTELVTSGVPQGSILGPLFFVLYVNDLPSCFKNCQSLMYADDLKLFRSIEGDSDYTLLQNDVLALSCWCATWKLKLNVTKCKILTFTNKKRYKVYDYKLDGTNLERVKHMRDLGVILSSDLSYNRHVNYVLPKAYKLPGFIKRNCLKDMKPQTLRRMYVSLVRPQVDYATVIWNPNKNHATNTRSIESIQKRFIKMLCYKSGTIYHRDEYVQLCNNLFLTTLFKRRELTDLIFLFRILHNFHNDSLLNYISFRVPSRTTRSHDTFAVSKPRINILKFSCIFRIQTCYNSLPHNQIDIHSCELSEFKKCINNLVCDLIL